MPGGFFLFILCFIFNDYTPDLSGELDFLYTFLFLCSAFIVGEILQTLSHELEWLVDIFFKRRRPSHIFLFKNNPVLKNEYIRSNILDYLNLQKEEAMVFNKDYFKLSFWKKENDNEKKLSQKIFWDLYSKVNNMEDIKRTNVNYLFTRIMSFEFLILSILFFVKNDDIFSFLSFLLFLVFIWRCRGIARGLVFKTVSLNLK
jgi:hypothetical protein